jgi:hypothetical protein
MGLDCGMRHGGQHHSTESTYYDGTMEKIQGDAPALNMNYVADHLKQDILDPEKQSIFEIPSVKGDKVFAQHLMWYSHIYLENLFRETPGMQAVQISEGAYINYATNVLPEDFDTEIIPSKSDDIMDRLLQRLVSLDGYIESYIKAARKIGADGDRLRRLISSHFERPIKSLDDWLKRLGTANNDIAPFRANDSLAWGLINGSYDKTTKSITERALMIEDQIFRLRFLQLGATKVQNIVSDMAASLKQLAPDLESIRTAQQNPIKISQQKSAVRHAD